jgi:hypothetical protein
MVKKNSVKSQTEPKKGSEAKNTLANKRKEEAKQVLYITRV